MFCRVFAPFIYYYRNCFFGIPWKLCSIVAKRFLCTQRGYSGPVSLSVFQVSTLVQRSRETKDFTFDFQTFPPSFYSFMESSFKIRSAGVLILYSGSQNSQRNVLLNVLLQLTSCFCVALFAFIFFYSVYYS